jgi:hypothetical protein
MEWCEVCKQENRRRAKKRESRRTRDGESLRLLCNRIRDDARTWGHTRKLVGVTNDEFRERMAAQFRPGMTWETYGETWTLDHVRPTSTFDLDDDEQRALCHSWMNLQPLPMAENLAKAERWSPADERAWVARLASYGYSGRLFLRHT